MSESDAVALEFGSTDACEDKDRLDQTDVDEVEAEVANREL